jgi:hypothetical protein
VQGFPPRAAEEKELLHARELEDVQRHRLEVANDHVALPRAQLQADIDEGCQKGGADRFNGGAIDDETDVLSTGLDQGLANALSILEEGARTIVHLDDDAFGVTDDPAHGADSWDLRAGQAPRDGSRRSLSKIPDCWLLGYDDSATLYGADEVR